MNKKNLFLLISFLIFVSFVLVKVIYVNSISLSNDIISINEKDNIVNSRTLYDKEIDLYYKGEKIPYILLNNYYLLSMIGENDFYSNIVTFDKFKLELLSVSDKTFSIIAYNDNFYKILDVVLTSLPVIVIDDANLGLKDVSSSMHIFDSNDKLTSVNSYNINYRIRGASSSLNDKKSYRISILNNNKKQNVSLLGMEYEDDWILNPLFFDDSFVREKIAYDIWNELSSDYKHQMEYVELVIGNDYHGLYGLGEIVDLDTFSATEDDFLFFINKWENEVFVPKLFVDDYVLTSSVIDEFEIEKGIDDSNLQLALLRSFKNSVKDLNSDIEIRYDLDNMANYSLFINLILASDNTYKNQKILLRNDNDYYTILKTPWDLDLSFNNNSINNFFYLDKWYVDLGIPKSISESKEFYNLMRNKYIKIRENIYNEEYLLSLMDEYESILLNSGAVERNKNRWSNSFYSMSSIRNFVSERILFLDNYFEVEHNGI